MRLKLFIFTACCLPLCAAIHAATLSAGFAYGMQIRSDGNLYAWGDNGVSQLFGDGTTAQQNTPAVVTLAPGVTAVSVSAGLMSNLAIGSDGNVYAWGRNDGTLGISATCSSANLVVSTPIIPCLP
jgi:alpha-tubulin suppressor-like RCC1 family protein